MTDGAAPPPTEPAEPADGALPADDTVSPPTDGADTALLGLIDRLAELLHGSDLAELEVEAGGTTLVLRKAAAFPAATPAAAAAAGAAPPIADPGLFDRRDPASPGREPFPPAVPSIKAPLTGLFYGSPAPGTAPYVQVGGEVAVGQIIGLIEAMKLFNEIKSDLAGRVIRVLPESGALVKAKQPLIEVEPL
jgi:acetyl-CoA carboxylase biotin carboxyl carrier protein